MVRDEPDWLTFRKHELALRRNHIASGISATDIVDDLRREWRALSDPRAYAQCITDIEDALKTGSFDFRVAEIVLQRESQPPLRQYEVDALYVAFQSQTVLFEALRRFSREQTRERSNGDANASGTSRAWTEGLELESLGRLVRIKTVWDQARAMYPARDETRVNTQVRPGPQAQMQPRPRPQTSNIPREGLKNDNDADSGRGGSSVHYDALASQHDQSDGDSLVGMGKSRPGRKRSRDVDDDQPRRGAHASSKSPRVSDDHSGPPILQEEISSVEGDLANLEPLEPEVDPTKDFEAVWTAFLESKQGRDRRDWEELFFRAQKLFKDTKEEHYPADTSPDGKRELRLTINKALEPALGWDWEEYVDHVKANENGLYKDGDLQEAEQGREDAMRKARDGRSPVWPPPPKVPVSNEKSTDEDESASETNDQIAEDIADGLMWEGGVQDLGQWKHLTSIGQGAQGEASLWVSVRSDDHGMIVERIVVKSIDIRQSWDHEAYWIANPFTNGENLSREKAMHSQLSSVGSASGIVKYLGSNNKDVRNFKLRLYMEYCPHGDLKDLLCKHAKFDRANSAVMLDDNDKPIPQVRIPLRALWSFFNDLAMAACIMELGLNPNSDLDEQLPHWIDIVHRDLKPNNIFLAAPLASTGRGIPVCKVGDFGTAVPIEFAPLRNPEDMWRAGTPGWKAPEQNHYADSDDQWDLSSKTNIWAIGRIMLALIELTPGSWPANLPDVRYDDEHEGEVIHSAMRNHLQALYGEELYGLVDRCLSPVPDDRITSAELLQTTQRQVKRLFNNAPPELEAGDVLEYASDLRWGK